MSDTPVEIDTILDRMERMAEALPADPDGHVRRTAHELRAAVATRSAIEPAVGRMRHSVELLRQVNHDGLRREFQRRAASLDHLDAVVCQELVPQLRRLGFDV